MVPLLDTPDEEFEKNIHLALYMLSMKHAFDDEMPIEEILKLVAQVYKQSYLKDHL